VTGHRTPKASRLSLKNEISDVVQKLGWSINFFERGAGETLACGTGACAAVVAGRRRGLLDERVRVATRGGDLTVAWAGDGAPVMMKGPARTVFEGEIQPNEDEGPGWMQAQ